MCNILFVLVIEKAYCLDNKMFGVVLDTEVPFKI